MNEREFSKLVDLLSSDTECCADLSIFCKNRAEKTYTDFCKVCWTIKLKDFKKQQ